MTKPQFEDFAYKGVQDDAMIERVVANRQKVYALSDYASETSDQYLATFLTVPEAKQGDEFIIRTTAFSDDNGRESGAVFDALLAASTGRRVLAANAPGVDFYGHDDYQAGQEMTPDQIEGLRGGSFNKVGRAVMRAVHHTALWVGAKDPSYIMTASSMGAAIAAGALAEARESNLPIKGVALAETVNVFDRSLAKLGMQFANQPHAVGYLGMNPEILHALDEPMHRWLERVRADGRSNWRYAKALARGAFFADLGSLEHLEGVPVYVTRGGGSSLSPERTLDALKANFGKVTNVDTQVFGDKKTNPHDHPYTMTVQSVIDAVNEIN
jgi:hypothetical protein